MLHLINALRNAQPRIRAEGKIRREKRDGNNHEDPDHSLASFITWSVRPVR